MDGEAFLVVPRERAAWIAHIKNNPNVGISCAEDSGTYKRITAQGKAEILFGPAPMQGQCLEVANRMAVRFLGERGPEYLVPTYDRPRYLVKIAPSKMLTWNGSRAGQEIYREIIACRAPTGKRSVAPSCSLVEAGLRTKMDSWPTLAG